MVYNKKVYLTIFKATIKKTVKVTYYILTSVATGKCILCVE